MLVIPYSKPQKNPQDKHLNILHFVVSIYIKIPEFSLQFYHLIQPAAMAGLGSSPPQRA